MRLKIVPDQTSFDFFGRSRYTLGLSGLLMVISIVSFFAMGLNFGIDFRGGTTIRTESTTPVDVGAYRQAIAPLGLGDVAITQVFDPSFRADQHVASIRIQALSDQESITPETVTNVEAAIQAVDPAVNFVSVESVGPKVSKELIWSALKAVAASLVVIMVYVWLRFEWQFALGSVAALIHDVFITIGVFAVFQIKFDLTTIAALLTIVGYSMNDTVVVFDRVRENLRRYKVMDLKEVLNVSINETLSRTFMTAITTLLALIALLVLGGDVIRGFVFAMTFGIIIGTYSSVFIATETLLLLGVKRDWSKPDGEAGTQFADVDA